MEDWCLLLSLLYSPHLPYLPPDVRVVPYIPTCSCCTGGGTCSAWWSPRVSALSHSPLVPDVPAAAPSRPLLPFLAVGISGQPCGLSILVQCHRIPSHHHPLRPHASIRHNIPISTGPPTSALPFWRLCDHGFSRQPRYLPITPECLHAYGSRYLHFTAHRQPLPNHMRTVDVRLSLPRFGPSVAPWETSTVSPVRSSQSDRV